MSAQPKAKDKTPQKTTEDDPFQEDLAQIMSEIDQIQVEMEKQDVANVTPIRAQAAPQLRPMTSADLKTDAPAATAEGGEEDILKEFHAGAEAESLEETLGELKHEDSPANTPFGGPLDSGDTGGTEGAEATESMESIEPVAPVIAAVPAPASAAAESGTLSMTLTGNMKLKLRYAFGTQEVTLAFGDDGLQLSLADGTEFKIPLKPKARKTA